MDRTFIDRKNGGGGKAARLIAGGILAASALLSLPQPAHAGRWGIDRIEAEGSRQKFKEHEENKPPTDGTDPPTNAINESTPYGNFSFYGASSASLPTTSLSVGPVSGVAADVAHVVQLRVVLKWMGYPSTEKPPAKVWLAITVTASSEAVSDEQGSHRDADKEHVEATADDKPGEAAFSSNGTARRASKTFITSIETNGLNEVKSRPIPVFAFAGIDGGRMDVTVSPATPLDGKAFTAIGLSASFASFSPDPNGLAIDDCTVPQQKPINQYLITHGIPCSITYGGSDTAFLERMRQEADWTLSRPPTLWPRLENRSNSYGVVLPVQYVTYDINFGSEDDGLKFDLRNGLPADNTGFGTRVLTHSLAGLGVRISADVALFFPATGTEHPDGNSLPRGYENPDANWSIVIPTPNWIYYYNKLIPSPEMVYYTPPPAGTNYQGLYVHGQSNVWLCDAHRSSMTAIFRVPSETVIVDRHLKFFGTEEVRGVDTYARVLKHELTHKRCWEYIHRSGADPLVEDSDDDRVPDAWERSVGLIVGERDTAGFTSIWGGSYGSGQGDSEVFARLYEEGVTGPMDSDWADTGLQRVGPPPNVCKRTIVRDKEGNVVNSLADLGGEKATALP